MKPEVHICRVESEVSWVCRKEDVNDVAPVQAMVNRWIGPGSAVNLKQDLIKAYYATVLSTAAQLSLR